MTPAEASALVPAGFTNWAATLNLEGRALFFRRDGTFCGPGVVLAQPWHYGRARHAPFRRESDYASRWPERWTLGEPDSLPGVFDGGFSADPTDCHVRLTAYRRVYGNDGGRQFIIYVEVGGEG